MITSAANRDVKNAAALIKKGKERTRQGLFIAEGVKMLLEAPRERVEQVFLSDSFFRAGAKEPCVDRALEELKTQPVIVSDDVFARLSDTKTPQGVLCVIRMLHFASPKTPDGAWIPEGARRQGKPFVMVLERLQDPGNLGTIVRAGEGAGVTGILMSEGCADIYNPKVIRSTMGSVFRVPFAVCPELPSVLADWQRQGMKVYAAHLQGSIPYYEADLKKSCAVMIGNESRGLSDGLTALSDGRVRIPMSGNVESLNAAVAASVIMYEAARQRRAGV